MKSKHSREQLTNQVPIPRSPPRLAELQSERRDATSSNLVFPETISSRMALSWVTALSLLVAEMRRPSGSLHEDFRRDPSCFMSMCDALTCSLDDISAGLCGGGDQVERERAREIVGVEWKVWLSGLWDYLKVSRANEAISYLWLIYPILEISYILFTYFTI